GAGGVPGSSPRVESDVQYRTLSTSAVRAPRDQGACGQLQGTEEGEGLGQAGRCQEEERRQEEGQAPQDCQTCGQAQAGDSQRAGSVGRWRWTGAAETAQLSPVRPSPWLNRAWQGARSAVPRVGNGATAGRPPAPAAVLRATTSIPCGVGPPAP